MATPGAAALLWMLWLSDEEEVRITVMSKTVVLRRRGTDPGHFHYVGCLRLRVEVLSQEGLTDSGIFVYERLPVAAEDAEAVDVYKTLADPIAMTDFPYGAPLDGVFPAYFRLSYVDLLHPTVQRYHKFWEDVQAEVRRLLDATVILDELEGDETTTITVDD